MKLQLTLLASVVSLSSGFMVELTGPLTEEACTGEEYAEFMHCATLGAAADPSLAGLTDLEWEAFVNRGGERQLSCKGCPSSGAPRGTYCFTMCGSNRRRGLEEGTDAPNLRRVQEAPYDVAVFDDGAYTGEDEVKQIAEAIMDCLGDVSTNHPCLGSTDTMTLTVTL
jgi:hypothetical protein